MSGAGVRIALVGGGAMGERVAREVYAQPPADLRVVAVVDARRERAEALAAVLGADAYGSIAEARDAGARIDAADVRVPHDAHAEVALAALEQGWHVLIEKPLATSLADADRIVDAAAERGVVVAVAENYPHLRAVQAAAAAIRDGEVGEVRMLRTTRAFTLEGVWVRDGWRQDAGPASGILLDQGSHHTSLLRRLGGEIVAVSAHAGRESGAGSETATDAEETLVLVSRFASGIIAQSMYSWAAAALDDEAEGTVFGSRARLEIRVSYDGMHGGAFRLGATSAEALALSPPENYYGSHRLIIEDWVSCIAQGGRPVVTVADARADLAVVLAAARSLAEDGRMVEVASASHLTGGRA